MFNRLHIYTVHVKPGKKPAFENPVFLREGFSVWAFVLTFFWTLYHRMWLVSGILIAVNIFTMTLQSIGIFNEGSTFLLLLAQQLIIGFHAHDWLRAHLKKRGHITAGIVTGDSLLRAEQRFFEHYIATKAESLPA